MIYEYKCGECAETSEVWAKLNDPAPEECPKCGAKGKLERVFSSGTSFALKGTGWYTTDYKKPTSSSGSNSN